MPSQHPTLSTQYRSSDPYGWLAADEAYQLPTEWVDSMPVPELHSMRIITAYDEPGQARAGAYFMPIFTDPDYGLLTLAEREFIGVVVSSLNACVTCLLIHTHKLGELIGNHGRARRIAVNYRTVSLSPQERAIADYCVKLTEQPSRIESSDLQTMREQGLSDAKLYYIVEVAAAFNFTNRITAGYGMRPDDDFMDGIAPTVG